jgi:hypothetical protein
VTTVLYSNHEVVSCLFPFQTCPSFIRYPEEPLCFLGCSSFPWLVSSLLSTLQLKPHIICFPVSTV